MNNLLCIMLITSSFTLLCILSVLFFNSYKILAENFKYIGETGLDLSKLYGCDTTGFITKIKSSNNQYNDDIGIGPILVINLDNDTERLHHLLSECKEENLYAVKTGNCCEGNLSEKTNNRFVYNEIFGRELYSGEKKCFLSHEMCWKKASKQKIPSLIVEDDITFPYDTLRIFKHIMDDINKILDSGGPQAITVRLGSTTSRITGKVNDFKQVEDTCLGLSDFCCGSWAYIVTPEAASTLLKISSMNNLSCPVDHFINPPSDRKSFNNYDKRMPTNNEYLFLDVIPSIFKPLKSRYILKNDATRGGIIKELSTSLNTSRSQIK